VSHIPSTVAELLIILCADSGNHAGDGGARALSKLLQLNRKLSVVHWDRNNTSPQGFSDVAAAMQRW